MTLVKIGRLLPLALPFLLACGGSGQNSSQPVPTAPKAIPADEALAATWGFLTLEHGTTVASQMPAFIQAGDARILTTAATSSCVTEEVTVKMGRTIIEYVFTNCGVQAVTPSSLNGSMTVSFSNQLPSFYTVEYNNLVATRGTQTWVFNGQKTIDVNLSAKQAHMTATNLSAVFTDSAHPETNRSFLYNANLNADWNPVNSVNTYKLSGMYSLTYTVSAATHTTGGVISAGTPLTWMTGCCYPVSGSIAFTKDTATASAGFSLPCGTLTLTPAGQAPQTPSLPACGQ